MSATTQERDTAIEQLPLPTGVVRTKRRRRFEWSKLNVLTGIAILVVLWEVLPRIGLVDPRALPPFSEIMVRLGQLAATPDFWGMVLSTIRTWIIGLAIASAGGFVLGLVIGLIPGARAFTHSTIEFLRPIPSVAFVPAVILVLGTGFQSGLVLITYAAVWPMLLQTLYGFDDIDPVARDTARSYGFNRRMTFLDLVWPSMLPYMFTGFRIAAGIALVLAVTAEMVIGTFGLGQGIALAENVGDTTKMYALAIITGVLGVLINIGTRALEKRTLRWHASVRNAETL